MPTMEDETNFDPYRSDGKLYGFICVVTGVDHPIGRAIAIELAAHGAACVYACSHSTQNALASEISELYPNTKIIEYPLHVSDEQDTLGLIDDILNTWGRLDVWVTSSGILGPSKFKDTSPDDLRKSFETNAMAPFFALKFCPAAMEKMTPKGNYPNAAPKDQKYGSIVVVSSVANTYGDCWGPCFTMSSHAALGVVKAGVSALKGTGVRINCISPGQVDYNVNMKDLDKGLTNGKLPSEAQEHHIGSDRAGRPSEVARVAGFLASGFSRGVMGANIVVDMF